MKRLLVLLLIVLLKACPVLANGYPQRIVSLGPIITENIFLLGAGERLVGDTSYCTRPEAARKKEKIGSVMEISIEKILGLHPDLVLATGLTQPHYVEKLQSLGIRVVRFPQPHSFAEICAQFIELGELLGLGDTARRIVRLEEDKVAAIGRRIAPLPPARCFLQIGSQPLFGAATDSFTSDFIRLAGGINVLEGQQTGLTGYEKIIGAKPEVILIAMMGSESGGVAAEERKKWLRFKTIPAARDERVFVLDPDIFCSPSPASFARGLDIVAGLLHPQPDGQP